MFNVYAINETPLASVSTLGDIFILATNIILAVGIALTIIFLILGGIQYMTAKGDAKAAGEARQALTNAIIGFIIVVGAFTIKTILNSVLGINTGNAENFIQ